MPLAHITGEAAHEARPESGAGGKPPSSSTGEASLVQVRKVEPGDTLQVVAVEDSDDDDYEEAIEEARAAQRAAGEAMAQERAAWIAKYGEDPDLDPDLYGEECFAGSSTEEEFWKGHDTQEEGKAQAKAAQAGRHSPMGHGPRGEHTLVQWRALQDSCEWRAAVHKPAVAQGQPSHQTGGQPASSSTDRPGAGRGDKKRMSWEGLLAEIIEAGEDEDPLVPPQKGQRKREDE